MNFSEKLKPASAAAIDDLLEQIEFYKVTMPFTTEELEYRIDHILKVLYPKTPAVNVREISLVPIGKGIGHISAVEEDLHNGIA